MTVAGLKVLLVDDEAGIRDLIREYMTLGGVMSRRKPGTALRRLT